MPKPPLTRDQILDQLEPWERELADHEHTLESLAAYFGELLRGNFAKERIVVEFDRGNELEPLPEELTPAYGVWESRRLARLISGRQ